MEERENEKEERRGGGERYMGKGEMEQRERWEGMERARKERKGRKMEMREDRTFNHLFFSICPKHSFISYKMPL